ncbi:MAG: ATP-binding protein [Saprospiraceae bacterium]|nr:ATP-binding protein [Saprospiraceae bacterium]
MLKIAITGPESTGKTTLTRQLAAHYDTLWVPEYARYYLTLLNRPYTQEDVLEIAKGQLHWESELTKLTDTLLFCDTDLIVIKIWLKFKYNLEDEWLESQLKKHRYDLHFLCDIDLPWQDDPLRENPNLEDRKTLYALYLKELSLLGAPFIEISGPEEERLTQAKKYLAKYL